MKRGDQHIATPKHEGIIAKKKKKKSQILNCLQGDFGDQNI